MSDDRPDIQDPGIWLGQRALDETVIVATTDRRGVITYVNRRFEIVSGYSKDELVGKTHVVVNSRVHTIQFWTEMWRTISSGKTWRGEICNRAKNGSTYWVDSTITPTMDPAGEISGYVAIRFDITDRKILEESARSHAKFSELLMNTTPVGILRLDASAKCSHANQWWCDLAGHTLPESLGDGWLNALHPADKMKVFQHWGDMVTGLTHFEQSFRILRADESERHVRCTAAPVRDEDGLVVSFLAAAVDITREVESSRAIEAHRRELIALNQDLEAKAVALEKASAAKNMFLANMSHELRTPLNGIIGMAQLLSSSSLNSEQKDNVEEILFSGNILLALINDLLDLTKIEAGGMTIEQAPFDLHDTIRHAVDSICTQINPEQIALKLRIEPDVPQLILGDSLRVRQILLNFLSNAVKFTAQGSIFVHATASASTQKPGNHTIHIAVQDTGIGITAEKRQKLFAPFTQADTSITRKYGGTGLGLVISKNLAQLLGGDVSMESTPNKGSTFAFHFQAQRTSRLQDLQVVPTSVRGATETLQPSVSLKILVAEDNATNQKVIAKFLQKMGLHPHFADNGQDAVRYCQEQSFDLIFMDLQMPVLSGLEACIAIRQAGLSQDAWIVAMTANAFEEDQQQCLTAGMDDFIAKPIRYALIEKMIQELSITRKQHSHVQAS